MIVPQTDGVHKEILKKTNFNIFKMKNLDWKFRNAGVLGFWGFGV